MESVFWTVPHFPKPASRLTLSSETNAGSTIDGYRVASNTEPCVAAVGWSEEQAAAQGIEYLTVSDTIHLMSDNERSVIDPEPTFLKLIIESGTQHLLGCLVVGDHAPVIANIVAIAMNSNVGIEKLRDISLVQPSASDALIYALRKLG